MEGCAFANFGNSSRTEGESPHEKELKVKRKIAKKKGGTKKISAEKKLLPQKIGAKKISE